MRTILRNIIFLHIFLFLSVAYALEPQVTVSPAVARMGDIVNLSVDYSYPIDTTATYKLRVEPLSTPENNTTTWTLLSQPIIAKTVVDNLTSETHLYKISAYQLGAMQLPNISLDIVTSQNLITQTINCMPDKVLFEHQLKGNVSYLPLKPPFTLPYPTWLIYTAIILLTLVGAVIAYFLYKYFKHKIKAISTPQLSPAEWAYAEIEKLETAHLIETRQYKELFTRVSEILRVYTEQVFGIASLDMTTEELIETIETSVKTQFDAVALLESILKEADLVKFAKYQPEARHCTKSMEKAKTFIDITKFRSEISPNEQQPQLETVKE